MPENLPPGARVVPDYLTVEQETALLAEIDARPWLTDLKRRVQHYGYRYDYRSKGVDVSRRLGGLPDWAAVLAARLQADGLIEAVPDQLIVNEYEPGQGIARHVDHVRNFGPTVVSLSLGSGCEMEFGHPESGETRSVYLAPRGAVVLSGPARYEWTHAIAKRKADVVDGKPVPRARRVSMTFRTVVTEGEA
jgi:alkylated DNA repair dioxygenase AlkB